MSFVEHRLTIKGAVRSVAFVSALAFYPAKRIFIVRAGPRMRLTECEETEVSAEWSQADKERDTLACPSPVYNYHKLVWLLVTAGY